MFTISQAQTAIAMQSDPKGFSGQMSRSRSGEMSGACEPDRRTRKNKRERQRRVELNELNKRERQRRVELNELFQELSDVVFSDDNNPQNKARKLNKADILMETLHQIVELQRQNQHLAAQMMQSSESGKLSCNSSSSGKETQSVDKKPAREKRKCKSRSPSSSPTKRSSSQSSSSSASAPPSAFKIPTTTTPANTTTNNNNNSYQSSMLPPPLFVHCPTSPNDPSSPTSPEFPAFLSPSSSVSSSPGSSPCYSSSPISPSQDPPHALQSPSSSHFLFTSHLEPIVPMCAALPSHRDRLVSPTTAAFHFSPMNKNLPKYMEEAHSKMLLHDHTSPRNLFSSSCETLPNLLMGQELPDQTTHTHTMMEDVVVSCPDSAPLTVMKPPSPRENAAKKEELDEPPPFLLKLEPDSYPFPTKRMKL
eukprot:g35709.t1